MKYFTRELYLRLQLPSEEEMDAADAAWDEAEARYEQRLQQILPGLPSHLRKFVEELRLHDAAVWSLTRQDDRLLMVLRRDIPPRDVVLVTYQLAAEPVIEKGVFPPEHCSSVMLFLYDEVDLIETGGQRIYTQSILFSNGWEVRLRFTDVCIELAQPVYPTAGMTLVPSPPPAMPQSA